VDRECIERALGNTLGTRHLPQQRFHPGHCLILLKIRLEAKRLSPRARILGKRKLYFCAVGHIGKKGKSD
jgi:hypothetical protein